MGPPTEKEKGEKEREREREGGGVPILMQHDNIPCTIFCLYNILQQQNTHIPKIKWQWIFVHTNDSDCIC